MAYKWTEKAPLQPGLYWAKLQVDGVIICPPEIVQVSYLFDEAGRVLVRMRLVEDDDSRTAYTLDIRSHFAGPIELPED